MVKGILLDIDGTIVDSNDAHAQAWVDAFAEYGYSIEFKDVRFLIGMGSDKLMPKLVPELNTENGKGKEISEKRREIFLTHYAPTLQPTTGARSLIEKLLAENMRIVIATSAHEDELERLLTQANVADLLHEWTTSSDVDASKPAPDIVIAALDKIGLAPEEVIMLGDTPYDIKSAELAGVSVVAMRCGGFSEESLQHATEVYDHPQDLLDNFHTSPLVK